MIGGAVGGLDAAHAGEGGGIAQRLVAAAVLVGGALRLAGVVLGEAGFAGATVGVGAADLAFAEHAEGLARVTVAVARALDAAEVGHAAEGALRAGARAFVGRGAAAGARALGPGSRAAAAARGGEDGGGEEGGGPREKGGPE